MALKNPPDGYSSVTPSLVVEGAAGCIDFLTAAFGATERMRMPMPDGGVAHAELQIGDSVVMVGDASPEFPASAANLYVYVEDSDAVFRRAVGAGATAVRDPETQFYGDRTGTLRDRWGNLWTVATHVEDVSDDEMMKRMAAMSEA